MSILNYDRDFPPLQAPAQARAPAPARAPVSRSQQPLFIAVVGATGVGKSAFIKQITNDTKIRIGTSLRSCTKTIEASMTMYETRQSRKYQLVLLDTPGFDDDEVSDADILEEIAAWLKLQHREGQKLSGLIYLHRITDERMGGQGYRNLQMLKALCGEESLKNVVLVTNRWEQLADKKVGEKRLNEDLLGERGFWRSLIHHQATHLPYDGTPEKATAIIDRIIDYSPTVLKIQDELAKGTALYETEAGEKVVSQIEKDLERRAKQVESLHAQVETLKQKVEDANRLLRDYEKLCDKQAKEREALNARHGQDKDRLEKRIQELTALLEKEGILGPGLEKTKPTNSSMFEGKGIPRRKNKKKKGASECVIS
ncbi:P-loop containing nucleoside triphosphate hydrolase protein [Kalaharituber pfeilii]|nr:P-loop containing nucleoside triphosphate hydrolase protein [Kalaharituber pfeilii]